MAAGIDALIVRMLTRQGFIDLFWEKLAQAREADPSVSREQVFNELNQHYRSYTGMYRYIDYECFRNSLKKKK